MPLPPSCQRGSDIDRNAIFRVLYDRWVGAAEGRKGTDLCEFLETRKQIVSDWRRGGRRSPPWWALVRLMADLGLELRVTEAGAVITGRRGKGAKGPATRGNDEVIAFQVAGDRPESGVSQR